MGNVARVAMTETPGANVSPIVGLRHTMLMLPISSNIMKDGI
jgi:hypothetical protein